MEPEENNLGKSENNRKGSEKVPVIHIAPGNWQVLIVGFMNVSNCILTDRLILRPFVGGDEDDLLAIMSDEDTARKAGFKPMSNIYEAARFMRSWRTECYAITERDNDSVIGVIQTPLGWNGKAFIGYWLDKEHRGKGYMTEAVQAVKEYLFDHTWADEIELYVYCGNDASRNVAIKCGFYPDFSQYKENTYSLFGTVESEERFYITRVDFEWEKSGMSEFSTAA